MAEAKITATLYDEPAILEILVLSSFVLVLNIVNFVFDNAIYCGLIGQILVGVAWGTPGGKLLDADMENIMVQLGYLGLMLLVYEGGLSTSFAAVKTNLLLSIGVAITGIALPIALSFTLQLFTIATPLQAFATGAALCSTSLGTTFTVLSASGLTTTRLGTVLTTAAMLDDVVGLIMVQVISNLGDSGLPFSSLIVIRPAVVSVGLVIVLILICRLLVKPLTTSLGSRRQRSPGGLLQRLLSYKNTAFLIHTIILFGMVAGAAYAGTSNLFAAYLAGASISWWDSEVSHQPPKVATFPGATTNSRDRSIVPARQQPLATSMSFKTAENNAIQHAKRNSEEKDKQLSHDGEMPGLDRPGLSGSRVYQDYYGVVVASVLKPLFFASIGFSIPVSQMFQGSVVWRGIVYTILMLLGKLLTGLWLVRFSLPLLTVPSITNPSLFRRTSRVLGVSETASNVPVSQQGTVLLGPPLVSQANKINATTVPGTEASNYMEPATLVRSHLRKIPRLSKPLSLYPASILGTAMVSRGEIGFLIASVAESRGIFAHHSSQATEGASGISEIFLIAIWAISLCTIIGPVSVGLLIRRVRKLQTADPARESGLDPLGAWGVI